MAKFKGIKDGDLLFDNSRNYIVFMAFLSIISVGVTFNFISEIFFGDPNGIWFFVRGVFFTLLLIFLSYGFYIESTSGHSHYQGFYLEDKFLFKVSRKKLFSSDNHSETTIYLKDFDGFLNGKGLIIDVMFANNTIKLKYLLTIDNEELILSKSYKKNKIEVIDFLNKKIKEYQIKSSEIEN